MDDTKRAEAIDALHRLEEMCSSLRQECYFCRGQTDRHLFDCPVRVVSKYVAEATVEPERGRKPVDVMVEVAGGVASVQCFREGVVVEVRDYDCVEDDPPGGGDPHVIRDESGRRCWRYFTEKSED